MEQVNDRMIISVQDNGGGISSELIDSIIDFKTRTSDKVTRRLPTRGAQGNALKTIIGIPHALGGGSVSIESKGIRHVISVEIKPHSEPLVTSGATQTILSAGTRVTVDMPCNYNLYEWEPRFLVFNPHVTFVKKGDFDKWNLPCSIELIENDTFYKWRPNEPTSIHWYTKAEFYGLLYLAGNQSDRPLGGFIREFKGLTSTKAVKAITANFSVKTVSELSEADAYRLYDLMITASKPVQPKALGIIGSEYWLSLSHGDDRHWYDKSELLLKGIPYLFECIAIDNNINDIYSGINHSPTYRDYLRDTVIVLKDRTAVGVRAAKEQILTPFTLIVHLVCPSLAFTDRGKTSLTLPEGVQLMIANSLVKILKPLYKESERARKGNAKELTSLKGDNSQFTQKDAVFKVLPDAIEAATSNRLYPTNVRSLYYKVRAAIQSLTDKPLDYGYFSQTLLIEYWAIAGRDELVTNDPRGILYEPTFRTPPHVKII